MNLHLNDLLSFESLNIKIHKTLQSLSFKVSSLVLKESGVHGWRVDVIHG